MSDEWSVWTINGCDDLAGDAYATETLAYAALGRHVAGSGYWSSDWSVERRTVQLAPPEQESVGLSTPRPAWLDEALPGPWVVHEDEDDMPALVSARGRNVARMITTSTSGDQDRELAEYLAALVNADRGTA